MFVELGSAITDSNIGKLLKFDQDAGKQIFVLTVICYLIFQMDMESLIVAYVSCMVYVLMLLQNRGQAPPKKKVFPVDVPYDSSCYDEDEDEEPEKQQQQQRKQQQQQLRQHQKTPGQALPALEPDANTDTNLFLKTRLSQQVQKSRDVKSCDRIEHLSAVNIVANTTMGNNTMHTTKSGFSAVAADLSTASFETQSRLAWPPGLPYPLEPQVTLRSPLSSSPKPDDSQLPSSPEAVRLPPGLFEPKDEGQNQHVLPTEVEHLPSSGMETQPEGNEPSGTLASLGADVHPDGCIPCKFLVSRTGCKDGEKCIYCHAPHPDLNQGQRRRLMSRINRKKRQEEAANAQSLVDEQHVQAIQVNPSNGNSEDVQLSNFEGWYPSLDYNGHYDTWGMQIQPSQEQVKVYRSAKPRLSKNPALF